MSSKKRKLSNAQEFNDGWDEAAEAAAMHGMSSDESEVSSDGLVADSASEVSDNGSEGSVSSSEQQLEEQEEAHIKKQAKESEEQEFSDPEYGYNSEDSENERTLHTIGDVPLHWYEDMDHIGYDLEGMPVARPKGEDAIDRFLALNETSGGWKTIYDEKTGKRTKISARDMEIIKQLRSGEANSRYDSEKWFIPVATLFPDEMPTTATPEPKSRFVPSKWEAKRIKQLAHMLKTGKIKLEEDKKEEEPQFFLIWEQNEMEESRFTTAARIAAPKAMLPSHHESYNPPVEYLFDEEELKDWQESDLRDRKLPFVPQKFNNLRSVPAYADFHKERFERCLDLYLVTRAVKKLKTKQNIQDIIPQLPKPSELRPFPTSEMMQYQGHVGRVRSISVDPTGQWLVSGGDDKTVRVFEIQTSRQIQVWHFDNIVYSVAWNPNKNVPLIAVATESAITLVIPQNASKVQNETVHALLNDMAGLAASAADRIKELVIWRKPKASEWDDGRRLVIDYNEKTAGKELRSIVWHRNGDYLASVSPTSLKDGVLVHLISKRLSQSPFSKLKGRVQCVRFHPAKPFFFVATERQIRVYNLVKQSLVKKLSPKAQWISSMDIHPGGDNFIVGTYDRKVAWFDMDFGTRPYKTLRYHTHAVRSVRFHPKYPLFASGSDDGTVQIFHATTYDDLINNALIVPLKILRGHKIVDDIGILDTVFHPNQPWIFTAGADSTIRLFVH